MREAREAGRRYERKQLSEAIDSLTLDRMRKTPDRDTHVLGVNVEAELEGRGELAKAARKAKRVATSDSVLGKATRGTALQSSGLNIDSESRLAKNVAKDAIDIPAQAVPSAYAVGAAAVESAQGRPERGKQLWKDFKEHDPLALVAQGKFDKAAKEAEKHPLLTAASVSGAGSVVSRGVGAGIRGSGAVASKAKVRPVRKAGKALKRAGSTQRAPAVAPGTGIVEQRSWSKGAGGKAVQVGRERVKIRKARRLRDQARRTRNPDAKVQLRIQAAQADPRVLPAHAINRRVDEREAMAEVLRRTNRSRAVKAVDEALPKRRADIALLIAQGVVKSTRKSLTGYKRDLDAQLRSGNLSKGQARQTRRLRDQLADALKDKKLDLKALADAGKRYAEVTTPRQRGLVKRGILDREAERSAKLIPVAVREMGAKWDPKAKRLELRGEKLPVSRIEAYLRSTGRDPDEIAYVTQAPNQRGARNFFTSWHEPKGISSRRRTGEATRKGSFAVDREVGRENVARMQGLQDAFDRYSGFVAESAYRPKGKPLRTFSTRDKAIEYAEAQLADSPYEWRAVPTRPQFGRKEQSEALLDEADSQDVSLERGVRKGIEDALEGDGSGQFVLVPETAAKRMSSHSRLMGSGLTKATRKIGRQFSGTVLTTSGPTWPLGNIAEGAVRLAIKRAGPASLALGRGTVKELRALDPDLADELEARIGTGHLGAFELNNVHAMAAAFKGTRAQEAARAIGTFMRAPGPKQAAALWRGWTHFIFAGNGAIEHQFRTALLGRHLRDQGYSPKKLALTKGTKALSTAAEQAARGMTNTNSQVEAARFIQRAYGQYEAFSPGVRATIAVGTPFIAWSLNAVRFVGQVLPRDHPVLTGLLASAERASEEWRNSYGLGKFIDGAAPAWMQASVPLGDNLHPIGRYTPFGFFADPLQSGGGLVLPQFMGILNATKGIDWKGDPIAGHDRPDDVGDDEKVQEMLRVTAGSFVPFFSMQERVRDKGPTALNPVRGYRHDRELSSAFEAFEEVESQKERIRKKRPDVDADNPTRRYARLHARSRELNERIYSESGGKYGDKYKGSGDSPDRQRVKELIAP